MEVCGGWFKGLKFFEARCGEGEVWGERWGQVLVTTVVEEGGGEQKFGKGGDFDFYGGAHALRGLEVFCLDRRGSRKDWRLCNRVR